MVKSILITNLDYDGRSRCWSLLRNISSMIKTAHSRFINQKYYSNLIITELSKNSTDGLHTEYSRKIL